MKKGNYISIITLLLSLTSCDDYSFVYSENMSHQNEPLNSSNSEGLSSIDESNDISSISISSNEITGEASISGDTSSEVVEECNVVTINKAGEYSFSGLLENTTIYVDVGDDDEVKIILDGAKITNSNGAPIYAKNADKVIISSNEGTYNEIIDSRSLMSSEQDNDDTFAKGAIYTCCDTNISGKGTLVVTSSCNNGIHCKDDLKIKNVTLKVTAVNNAIKGNDSLEIESGNIIAISSGGDALKTDNSSISSKGNQKGTLSITGGNIELYAACDGIDSAYDVIIDGGDLSIYTDKYSSYTSEVISNSETTLYLKMQDSLYNENYRYACYFYNSDTDGVWKDATYYKKVTGTGFRASSYYYYSIDMPSNYKNFKVARFNSTSTTNSLESYESISSGITINSSYDTVTISGIRNKSISFGGWSNINSSSQSGPGGGPGGGQFGPGGMDQGNTDKTDYSTKGIKADNEIVINGGKIYIKSRDDGIHSNYDNALENEQTPLGNVTINDGDITIYSNDDGIHADDILNINGGNITISNSYEGIEATILNINGGNIKVNASDDGLNARSGDKNSPAINISGGLTDIYVGSGDVDGIDSNGTFTLSGGVVITRGSPGSANRMATGLDCDKTVSITKGTLICIGQIESTPSKSTGVNSVSMSRKTISSGSYTISGLNISFEVTSSYSGFYVYSDLLVINETYNVTGGTSFSWTQSSSSVTG